MCYDHAVRNNNLIQVNTNFHSNGSGRWINFGLLNPRSVRNKAVSIYDFVIDQNLDFLALTETWLSSTDESDITEALTPEGYTLTHTPRGNKDFGGGVGLLTNSSVKCKVLKSSKFKSFELQENIAKFHEKSVSICVVYRPPPSNKNGLTLFNLFIDEFSEFLAGLCSQPESLLILGDINIHIDNFSDTNAMRYLDLLSSFNLTQKVHGSTHTKGHCIDHLIVRQDDVLVKCPHIHDPGFSDHYAVMSSLFLQKPQPTRITREVRNFKDINISQFSKDLADLELDLDNINSLANSFNSSLISVINNHAPVGEKTVTIRPNTAWYSSEIRQQKVLKRRPE